MDSVRVWSFGAGDSGKLGHGDTNRQLLPKVRGRGERWRGEIEEEKRKIGTKGDTKAV